MPKQMLLAGVVLGALALSAPLAAQSCLRAPERDAINVRLLQTELMVAALSCQGSDYPSHYNDFVRKFTPELVSHSKALKDFFDRRHSAKSRNELDSFVTRIANMASLRSMQTSEFCEKSGTLIHEVLTLSPVDLASYSTNKGFADTDSIVGCQTSPAPQQRSAAVAKPKSDTPAGAASGASAKPATKTP